MTMGTSIARASRAVSSAAEVCARPPGQPAGRGPGTGSWLVLLVGVGDAGLPPTPTAASSASSACSASSVSCRLERLGRGLDLVRGRDRLVLGVPHVGELRMRLDPAIDERSTTCERRSVERTYARPRGDSRYSMSRRFSGFGRRVASISASTTSSPISTPSLSATAPSTSSTLTRCSAPSRDSSRSVASSRSVTLRYSSNSICCCVRRTFSSSIMTSISRSMSRSGGVTVALRDGVLDDPVGERVAGTVEGVALRAGRGCPRAGRRRPRTRPSTGRSHRPAPAGGARAAPAGWP